MNDLLVLIAAFAGAGAWLWAARAEARETAEAEAADPLCDSERALLREPKGRGRP
ncbi:MAG TPA: hypothetical protein VF171_06680 [Trueperaceae bacterium]